MNGDSTQGECCDYCGLPIERWSPFGAKSSLTSRSPHGSRPYAVGAEAVYCCFGCRFAAAVTVERGPRGELSWTLARLGLATFLTMNVMMFTMALWASDVYALDEANAALSMSMEGFLRYLCLLLSLPVAWMLGLPLADNGWRSLRQGRPGADLLLVLGVVAAFALSAVSTIRGQGHVYFEVGCVVLVAVTLGRWLEATGRLKTTQALNSLEQLLPDSVRLLRDGREWVVPLMRIAPGDVLRVLPGERLPVDGVVERGVGAIDEQLLTGESQPAIRSFGQVVHGGTLNLDGELYLRVTAGPREGALQRLIDAVHRARHAKGHYERLADRVARWFMPGVATAALITLAAHAARSGLEQGVLASLAVVLIACPCALGLATPMAAWAALGTAARAQVLFRDAGAIERLAQAGVVAFDKTGTLTTGAPRIRSLLLASLRENADEVLGHAAALANGSTHALATAIGAWIESGEETRARRHFACEPVSLSPQFVMKDIRALPGRGMVGRCDDLSGEVWLGSLRLMQEQGQSLDEALGAELAEQSQAAGPLAAIGWNGWVRGVFLLEEQLRPAAREALADCQAIGLATLSLTGDRTERGAALARELGIEVQAGLLPDDKVAALHGVRKRHGPVVMVGDGVNDAPALSAADVGIALGCGADISRQSADVCLLGNDLRRVAWSVVLARRSVRTMRQNLFWALSYNTVGIGLAATGWLNPIWASAAMVASSVLVIGNSLRLTGDPSTEARSTAGRPTRASLEPMEAQKPSSSPTPQLDDPALVAALALSADGAAR